MPDRPARILIVDADPSTATLLSAPLQQDGFDVVTAVDGPDGLERFAGGPCDLVIIDTELPRMDGLEVCRRIRAHSRAPIIMLGAHTHEMDRILALELGADDHVGKPFSYPELRARIRAALRRAAMGPAGPATAADAQPIEVHGLRIDPGRRLVLRDGEPAPTTFVEFEILFTLARDPGRVHTRDALLERVWGDSAFRDPRTVDVHIRHLREKVEPDPAQPRFILTVRGVGYSFSESP